MSNAIDPAKEVARELHGLIRDGRKLERDLRKAQKDVEKDIVSLGTEAAEQYIAVLNKLLQAHLDQVTQTINRANGVLKVRAMELSGMTTPAEFMENIIKGLTPRVAAVLEETAVRAAAAAAVKTVEELHAPPQQGRRRQQQPEKLPPAIVTPSVPSADPASLLRIQIHHGRQAR